MKNLRKLLVGVLFMPLVLQFSSCGKNEINTNVPPTDIRLSKYDLKNNEPAGTLVATISAQDDDSGPHVFSLVSGSGDDHNDKFTVNGTSLYTKEVVDDSDGKILSIRLIVNDGEFNFSESKKINIVNSTGGGGNPEIHSSTFPDNGFMPKDAGRDHGNLNPQITISNVPDGTKSMVLTMRDLDAGNSWHWAVWNIPPSKVSIRRGQSWSGTGAVAGNNDYGAGYTGPFPPSTHRYEFTVFFLKEKISLSSSQYKSLSSKMSGILIDEASMIGKYTP